MANIVITEQDGIKALSEALGWVDVRGYGAVGDGITDDTAAINAAIDSLTSGGTIYIPFGSYKITGVIGIADTTETQGNKYRLVGNGSIFLCATGLTAGTIRIGTNANPGDIIPIYIDDLFLDTGETRPSDSSIGIYVTNRQRGQLNRVYVAGFQTGLLADSWDVADGGVINCSFTKNKVGLETLGGPNKFSLKDSLLHWNEVGAVLNGGHSNVVMGNHINNNTDTGLELGTHATEVLTNAIVKYNHFEGNVNYDVVIGGAQPVRGGDISDNDNVVGAAATAYWVRHIQFSPKIGPNKISGEEGNTTYKEYEFATPYSIEQGVGSNSYNWIKNSDFSKWSAGTTSAPDGWTLVNATISKDTSFAIKESNQGIDLISDGTWAYLQHALSSNDVKRLRGKWCQLSAWVSPPLTNDKTQVIALVDDSGIQASRTISSDGEWHYITFQVKPDNATANIYIRLYANYSAVADANDGLYACNISLREGLQVIPYLPNPQDILFGLPIYANNAAALAGGLVSGDFYRTNGDPDPVCIVH